MRNLFENIHTNAKLELLISEMEVLLSNAKKSQPAKDFTSQTDRIKSLRDIQMEFLEIMEENRIINKMHSRMFAENQKYEIALMESTKELDLLKTENTILKQNINSSTI